MSLADLVMSLNQALPKQPSMGCVTAELWRVHTRTAVVLLRSLRHHPHPAAPAAAVGVDPMIMTLR